MSNSKGLRKISFSEAEEFSREGFDGYTYIDYAEGLGFNVVLVNVHGKHPRKRMIGTTRTYFVIEGSGTFTLGKDDYPAGEGDLFIIPPGSEYAYEGEMKLYEVNISPDNIFQSEIIE